MWRFEDVKMPVWEAIGTSSNQHIATSKRSNARKCLFQISQQIVDILHAYADADQVVDHPYPFPHVLRYGAVGHGSRVVDQRLHAAQRFGQGEDLERRSYLECLLEPCIFQY